MKVIKCKVITEHEGDITQHLDGGTLKVFVKNDRIPEKNQVLRSGMYYLLISSQDVRRIYRRDPLISYKEAPLLVSGGPGYDSEEHQCSILFQDELTAGLLV